MPLRSQDAIEERHPVCIAAGERGEGIKALGEDKAMSVYASVIGHQITLLTSPRICEILKTWGGSVSRSRRIGQRRKETDQQLNWLTLGQTGKRPVQRYRRAS